MVRTYKLQLFALFELVGLRQVSKQRRKARKQIVNLLMQCTVQNVWIYYCHWYLLFSRSSVEICDAPELACRVKLRTQIALRSQS